MLTIFLGVLGVLALLVSSVAGGYRAQVWMQRRAPALYAKLPRDAVVLIGLALGAAAVYRLIAIP
jgi:hypothetical protein